MEITNHDIKSYIEKIDEKRQKDIVKLIEIGKKLTKKEPELWGSIIGFGKLHYTYKTGREGDMPLFGFANRKQAITLYLSYDINKYEELNTLGKHKTGQGCLYINKLEDIDIDVLEDLIKKAMDDLLKSSMITVVK